MTARIEPSLEAVPALELRRKRQILPAVISVIAEEGFDGATMRKIADRAGVSVGMLTYYWRDKRHLIEDSLRDAQGRANSLVDSSIGEDVGPHRIEALFENMLEGSRTGTFPLSFWLAYWGEAARDEELRRFSLGGLNRVRQAFLRALETGIAQGELEEDLNAENAASLLMTLWQGVRAEVGLGYATETDVAVVIEEALRLMRKR
jgi:AcrR family transcriptional regulator